MVWHPRPSVALRAWHTQMRHCPSILGARVHTWAPPNLMMHCPSIPGVACAHLGAHLGAQPIPMGHCSSTRPSVSLGVALRACRGGKCWRTFARLDTVKPDVALRIYPWDCVGAPWDTALPDEARPINLGGCARAPRVLYWYPLWMKRLPIRSWGCVCTTPGTALIAAQPINIGWCVCSPGLNAHFG